ncbi:hypothetical protein QYE76_032452 [Lolium multiflorum]|uniref:Uncharacterized protein n=1 Tax=Lolium multiflorum TaxID=4521 RepID=A0AAD8VLD1_LOLMU|nr:hypothetical protein QYE76_032451 [Lolium multiflorum]KAK1608779.1 hypothetical protein QYE76_032452 [Lolium multiflorum]
MQPSDLRSEAQGVFFRDDRNRAALPRRVRRRKRGSSPAGDGEGRWRRGAMKRLETFPPGASDTKVNLQAGRADEDVLSADTDNESTPATSGQAPQGLSGMQGRRWRRFRSTERILSAARTYRCWRRWIRVSSVRDGRLLATTLDDGDSWKEKGGWFRRAQARR